MQTKLRNLFDLASRLFLSAIFLASSFGKMTGFAGTVAYMAQAGVPSPKFLLPFAILFEIVGGLSILLGLRPKVGASLLLIFLAIVTPIFHNPTGGDQMQAIQFLKNLAIAGGLLGVIAHGIGPVSLDNYLRNKSHQPIKE